MPDIVNLEGEVIGTDQPPLSAQEWDLLLYYADLGAFDTALRTKNPSIYQECQTVARVVARYRRDLP